MAYLIYNTVDVFAENKYAGNQLAVFRNCTYLDDSEMQQIAKEMNYSETTFILSEKEIQDGYDVRIFTPAIELPFAGHPTLGTAFIIQQKMIQKPVEKVILNLKVGQIPVTFNYENNSPGILWMKQKPPVFGQIVEPAAMARALRLDKDDIDTRFPVQEVSTGTGFFIVPLKTLDAVKRARTDVDLMFPILEAAGPKAVLVFCSETIHPENQLNVRVFVDYYGVPEDPATGSGNGCLAGYLVMHRYFDEEKIDVRAEQGYEIGRPSLLYLKSDLREQEINIRVGGRVIPVAEGRFI